MMKVLHFSDLHPDLDVAYLLIRIYSTATRNNPSPRAMALVTAQ